MIVNNNKMRYLKTYKQLLEALTPSQFRPYMEEFDKDNYKELFETLKAKYSGDKNSYRIYIPLEVIKNKIEEEISKVLSDNGYIILDYIKGACKVSTAKNPSKIGQVLTRLKQDELMKKFVSDNSRKSGSQSNLLVVLSRHPYDIAGSDTDRSWTNCMTLATPNGKRVNDIEKQILELDEKLKNAPIDKIEDIKQKIDSLKTRKVGYEKEGANAYKLINDVKHGSLITYLINKDDLDIKNPIANLNIKPYRNTKKKKDIILVSDTVMYGQGMAEYKDTVDKLLNDINGIDTTGLFKLKDGLYIDSHSAEVKILKKPKDEEDIIKILKDLGIEDYTITNMIVDVDGDVNISDKGIKNLTFKFGVISGDFDCSVNRFENLHNMPNIVKGDFNCSINLLTTLEGSPKDVTGLFNCSKNRLKDLDGIGKYGSINFTLNTINPEKIKTI